MACNDPRGFNDNYDDKWGRFTSEQRFNVDQSPCPFALNLKRTYHVFEDGADQHQGKVWISQQDSGLDKRQCSLQICVQQESNHVWVLYFNRNPTTSGYCISTGIQPRLGIVFQQESNHVWVLYFNRNPTTSGYCISTGIQPRLGIVFQQESNHVWVLYFKAKDRELVMQSGSHVTRTSTFFIRRMHG